MQGTIHYPGVAAAVAGVVGMLGVYADWWESPEAVYAGTADVSGTLALVMSLGLFVFGAASVLLSEPRIRRAMNVLFTLCAVVLSVAAIWGFTRSDAVAGQAEVSGGLWISLLAGAIGIAAGALAMRTVREPG